MTLGEMDELWNGGESLWKEKKRGKTVRSGVNRWDLWD